MDNQPMNFMIMNNKIFRHTQIYLDKALKKYGLSSGSFRYLFTLEQKEGICQNEISARIGNDKAMSTRIIQKLEESGFLLRQPDAKDNRAYQLFLTDKGKEVIPKVRSEINLLQEKMTKDLTEDEKSQLLKSLYKVFCNTCKENITGGK